MTLSQIDTLDFDTILQNDETIGLNCEIVSFNIKDSVTVFKLKVHRLCFIEQFWYIFKRYSDFHLLHNQIEKFYCKKIDFPPKKLIGNKSKMFLIQRMNALQVFVDFILSDILLSQSLITRQFFDPKTYHINIYESIQKTVSGTLCTSLQWGKFDFVDRIGWRIHKQYFRVSKRQFTKDEEYLGHIIEFGPYKTLRSDNISAILQSIEHPYLTPTEYVTLAGNGLIVIRKMHKNGSLRDYLNNNKKMFNHFLKKYSSGTPNTLNVDDIRLYGKQILLLLEFMQQKNIIFGHLHCGNIAIDDSRKEVRVLDFENGLIGVPSFYQSMFLKSKLLNSQEAINIYTFGHVLYEMTFGNMLPSFAVDFPVETCDSNLNSILEQILTKNALQSRLPTVKELLQHEFFREVTISEPARHISKQYSNELTLAFNRYQIRLKEIQVKIARKQRQLKEQELSSEIVWKTSKRKTRLDRTTSLCSFAGSISSTSSGLSLQSPQSLHSAPIRGSEVSRPPIPPPLPPPLPPLHTMTPQVVPSLTNGVEEFKPKKMSVDDTRNALLKSINNFNKSLLRKIPS